MEEKTLQIQNLIGALEEKRNFQLNMIIGLDGFVDEIIHVVDQRQDVDNFTRINNIEDLGKRIIKAGGLSTNIELVSVHTKLGGNGPILANALLEYGVQELTYIGSVGVPDIHPVFKPMTERCRTVYPLCNPGHTDALEFHDGKLMLGKITPLNQLTWERCKEVVGGPAKFAEMIRNCQLFGAENWTMIPYMSDIFQGIIDEILPLLPDQEDKPLAFFDLCDTEKRKKEDILEAMKRIGKFESKFRAILGLNESELYQIANVFGIVPPQSEETRLKETATRLYNALGIYCLVVHPTREALCLVNGEYYHTMGPYCPKPKLSTGAGDNFNAGFCFGQALGLDPLSSLILGTGTSGFYVRNAKSPTYQEMIEFLAAWAADRLNSPENQ